MTDIKISDAREFVGWLIEDTAEVCAEVGSGRNEQLKKFVEKGFLRHVGTFHGTSNYAITSGYIAALSLPSTHRRTTEGEQS